MAFPYTYKNIVELTGENFKNKITGIEFVTNLLVQKIKKQEIKELEHNNNNISFKSNSSLFGIIYKIKINVFEANGDINIEYEILLDVLLKITLFAVIFIAFFSFISVSKFLIFAGLFIILFYSINLLFINSYILKFINDIIGKNLFDFDNSETLSNEQKEWINNPDKCPACGYYIDVFDLYCPDCGLKVKKNKFAIPLDTTKYHDKTIKYHYKE